MAARKTKGTKDVPWPQVTRDKIQGSMLINRLEKHVLGEVEMQPSQVSAALGLLRKTLPDLQAVHSTGGGEEKTLAEWLDEIEASAK